MFMYTSGFVSELDLQDKASVYVFLLFPQKYVKNLSPDVFPYMYRNMNLNYSDSSRSAYLDKNGSVFDHYIPFAMPFKAEYCRDTGIYLNEPTAQTKWIDDNFNVSLYDYLCNLAEKEHAPYSDNLVIDENNIFDYISVALEYVSFVDRAVLKAVSDDGFIKQFHSIEALFDCHNVAMIQNHVLGRSLHLKSKGKTALELINASDDIEEECLKDAQEMTHEVVQLAAFEFFMVRVNKIYKPCNGANQTILFDYQNELDKAKAEIYKKNNGGE